MEVGVQALDCMIEILKSEDRNDEEIVGYSLDTLANICSPDEFEEEIQVGWTTIKLLTDAVSIIQHLDETYLNTCLLVTES